MNALKLTPIERQKLLARNRGKDKELPSTRLKYTWQGFGYAPAKKATATPAPVDPQKAAAQELETAVEALRQKHKKWARE